MTKRNKLRIVSLLLTTLAGSSLFGGMMGFPTIENYDKRSDQYGVKLSIPDYPETPEDIRKATKRIIRDMNNSGDDIADLESGELTFENTFHALDLISHKANTRILPINIVKNTSTDEAMREAATEAMKAYEEATIEFNFREDIFWNLSTYADSNPNVHNQEQLLIDDTMLEYKRRGYDLAIEKRKEVERLQKKLAILNNDFGDNIRNSNEVLVFSAKELEGIDSSFLESIKSADGKYEIRPNISHHAMTVYKFAKSEAVRKQVFTSRSLRAKNVNGELLKDMIRTRFQLAQALGYGTWADYKTETRMAKNGGNVASFLEDLVEKLDPKFQKEYEGLQNLKRAVTGDSETILNIWDVNYFQEKQNKLKFDIDTEELKQFFPYERCVAGLFEVYETVFSIDIEEIENPNPWDPNVALYAVSDAMTEKPLGLFYMDPFPREGKYNHFAQFTIIPGAELEDGVYQRPTVAMICNFPAPENNRPSLLTFDHVETLFHEFGHCMHSILTEAKFYRHSGTSVARDFVEVPSQIMEYWLEDKSVLDLFAAHWQDQSKRLPTEWIEKIAESKRANAGMFYRRQLAIASMDMAIHHTINMKEVAYDPIKITNQTLARVYLPAPEGTSYITGIGHMAGYDAGYYGYAWADVIAADMASVFQNAPDGFMDEETGLRLRKEVFQVGGSRDVNETTKEFLGRESNAKAFIKSLGIETQ